MARPTRFSATSCRSSASARISPIPIGPRRSPRSSTRTPARVFCETVGNPAGNVCDLEALADVAHRAGVPLIVDNTVPTPILIRPIDYGADIVVHSLTKFLGGHGTTMGGIIIDSGKFPWTRHAARFPMLTRARRVLSRLGLHRSLRTDGLHRPLPQRLSAHDGIGPVAAERLPAPAGHRDGGVARRAPRRECAPRGRVPARRPARGLRELCRLPRQSLLPAGAEVPQGQDLLAADLRDTRRLRCRDALLRCAASSSSAW